MEIDVLKKKKRRVRSEQERRIRVIYNVQCTYTHIGTCIRADNMANEKRETIRFEKDK